MTHPFLSTWGLFWLKRKKTKTKQKKKTKVSAAWLCSFGQAGPLPARLPVGALGTKGTFGLNQTIVLDIQMSGLWQLGISYPNMQPACSGEA